MIFDFFTKVTARVPPSQRYNGVQKQWQLRQGQSMHDSMHDSMVGLTNDIRQGSHQMYYDLATTLLSH